MQKLFYFFTILTASLINSQNLDNKYLEKVTTLDSTMKTVYSVISGEKGDARNWELMRYLYYPKAQMMATGKQKEGNFKLHVLTPEDYIEKSGPWLIENGFIEKEIHREVSQFGNIAQVFSTYQCFKSKSDKTPFMRGINSIQLLHDGNRWWVVNIFWQQESPENPIPKNYLPEK